MKNKKCKSQNSELRNFKIFNTWNNPLTPFIKGESICNLQSGFTLLEVMVAIVILGLGLTVVFELFSGGLKSVEISNDYSNAVILANKKMGELSIKEMLKAGKETGDFSEEDNYKWEVEIVTYGEGKEKMEIASPLARNDNPIKIYQVTVRVFWEKGLTEKDVKLTSLRTYMEKPLEEKTL